MLAYEWDEAKRLINLTRHSLNFEDTGRVYEHPNKVTINDPYPNETRFRALAEVDGTVRLLVYTMRGEAVRCISFRAASHKEREFYYEQIKKRS
jgi:uncharacterized DUF497 family protein